jgi:ribosomal protein S27AE
MEGDRPIQVLLPEIEGILDKGRDSVVFLKWTCPRCGERAIAHVANKFCTQGYVHKQRHDGSPCGGIYLGSLFGYAIVLRG